MKRQTVRLNILNISLFLFNLPTTQTRTKNVNKNGYPARYGKTRSDLFSESKYSIPIRSVEHKEAKKR